MLQSVPLNSSPSLDHQRTTTNPFLALRQKYDNIYAIVSPPRCSSTAFSRVFWEHPAVRYYSHEPFEVTYYMNQDLQQVYQKMLQPLDLALVKKNMVEKMGNSLVMKEMPYQVGKYFNLLAETAVKPIIFLIRDPRLNISSRIEKKEMVGDSYKFPLIETGWELIAKQIEYCRTQKIPHMIVDSSDFRNHPTTVFRKIFTRLGLPFSEEMLTWQATDVEIDNLDGEHRHLYERVLSSKNLQPATEFVPTLDMFPSGNGFRSHLSDCIDIYRSLRRAPERVMVV
ncbi:MAG: hypothetical protein DWQ04_03505 [Chloroflexi bacterium]|nr:MAG: hypothetical protein DWQ04_03505 [Chloroflexota bacterium]